MALDPKQDIEMFRSLVTTAKDAIKIILLINGGSAVALLAFIGHLQTAGTTGFPQLLATAMLLYVFGVLFAAVAAAGFYFTQYTYYHKPELIGGIWRNWTIGF